MTQPQKSQSVSLPPDSIGQSSHKPIQISGEGSERHHISLGEPSKNSRLRIKTTTHLERHYLPPSLFLSGGERRKKFPVSAKKK